ncbi:hypothetical protein [Oerskovia sp. USHLN155]|uniref:hypothetical protein n=1 Tax=Oerskovia sp. USHLN155 TaxID=3081288 RepID=UPI0030185A60
MDEDPELEAMRMIATALEPLDGQARQRTLAWAYGRFADGMTIASSFQGRGEPPVQVDAAVGEQVPVSQASAKPLPDESNDGPWDHFAELYDAAGPSTDGERLLVAAYWVQVVQGGDNFSSFALNSVLKDLGHAVGHISERTAQLVKQKPALILQLRKSGSTRQARKTFKLSRAGSDRVRSMIGGS